MGIMKPELHGALRTEQESELMNHYSKSRPGCVATRIVLHEDGVVSMLYLGRRRAARAQKRFVLMVVDVKPANSDGQKNRTLAKVTNALLKVTRETDIVGWYLEDHLIGVIGTEVGTAKPKTVQSRMLEKVRAAFIEALTPEKVSQITVSFHFFPEEWEENGADHSANITLYPDFSRRQESRKLALGVNRAMDVVGSAAALVLLSPVFGAVALAIKLTSKGPVLFKQERLGQYGKKFTVLAQ